MHADPAALFPGVVVVIAPHMDDGVLGCGGTIAGLPNKECVHFIYATDGSQSPVPAFAHQGTTSPKLNQIRMAEAREALTVLGVPGDNIHFLNLPDGALNSHSDELERMLTPLLHRLAPQHIFAPFRYDRHPDHLALHTTVRRVVQQAEPRMTMVEYFVYYRWQMMPAKDIRRYLRPDQLLQIDTAPYAAQKREALQRFKSQTTLYFGWQDRPILPPGLIEEVAKSPEWFLRWDPRYPDGEIMSELRHWFQFVRRVEPQLKKAKEQMIGLTGIRRWRNGDG